MLQHEIGRLKDTCRIVQGSSRDTRYYIGVVPSMRLTSLTLTSLLCMVMVLDLEEGVRRERVGEERRVASRSKPG